MGGRVFVINSDGSGADEGELLDKVIKLADQLRKLLKLPPGAPAGTAGGQAL